MDIKWMMYNFDLLFSKKDMERMYISDLLISKTDMEQMYISD